MSSQPQSIASSGDYTVVACVNEVVVLENGRLLFTENVKYDPKCVAINSSQTAIAVGGEGVSLQQSNYRPVDEHLSGKWESPIE